MQNGHQGVPAGITRWRWENSLDAPSRLYRGRRTGPRSMTIAVGYALAVGRARNLLVTEKLAGAAHVPEYECSKRLFKSAEHPN